MHYNFLNDVSVMCCFFSDDSVIYRFFNDVSLMFCFFNDDSVLHFFAMPLPSCVVSSMTTVSCVRYRLICGKV